MRSLRSAKFWLLSVLIASATTLILEVFSGWRAAAFFAAVCASAFLAVQWRLIFALLRIDRVSLAHVENSYVRIPKRWEVVTTNVLTVLFLVLSVQFVAIVYAMSFSLSSSTSATDDTRRVILGDFDGDGDLDYVEANAGALGVHVNSGNGSFAEPGAYGAFSSPGGMAAGDIDGDGDLDIVLAQNNDTRLSKYTNNGAGAFTESHITSSLPCTVSDVALADMNYSSYDGDLDIVLLCSDATMSRAVWVNNGHGVFTQTNSYLPIGDSMAVADYNDDGMPDVFVLRATGGVYKVMQYSTTGSFIQLSGSSLAGTYGKVTPADLDNDGDIDVVLTEPSSSIKPYLNNGAGSFTAGFAFGGAAAVNRVKAVFGDMSNDGHFDAVVVGSDASAVSSGNYYYQNDQAAGFNVSGSPTETTECSNDIAIGDIDGDGDLDYVAGNAGCSSGGAVNRHYKSDQAATSANTAPSAPSSLSATLSAAYNTITDVQTTGEVAEFTSVALGADGFPVIAHYELTSGDLHFVKCGNKDCSSGNTLTNVDNTGDVGKWNSVAVPSDGLPFIAYYDTANADLKALKCGNAACTSGNTITTVDSAGDTGWYPSVAIASNGYPVISFFDDTTLLHKLLVCGNAACSSGNVLNTVTQESGQPGYQSSIGIPSDGLPIIAYFNVLPAAFQIVKCGNTSCTSGNTVTTLDSAISNVYSPSLKIGSDGYAVMSYYDVSNADLKVLHCTNATCSTNSYATVDSSGDVGSWHGLAVGADGYPIIGYYDATNQYPKIAKCSDVACSSGYTITTVDTPLTTGKHVSIVMPSDGRAFLAYQYGSSSDLRTLKCGRTNCADAGSDGSVIMRLSWGSGSDTQTPTRMIQYRLKVGTGSNANNIVSGAAASPNYTLRGFLAANQSRKLLLKNLTCDSGKTYYWSVASVDAGFLSTWSSQNTFILNDSCVVGAVTTTAAATGGGTKFITPVKNDGGGGGDIFHLTVQALNDVNANGKRESREQNLKLSGLTVTASGVTIDGSRISKTATLAFDGRATFDLPTSGPSGYTVFFDTGSLVLEEYVPTGPSVMTGIVLRASGMPALPHAIVKDAALSYTLTLPFRHMDLLGYAPCMSIVPSSTDEEPGSDAEIFLQRLRDPFGLSPVRGTAQSGALMTRGNFFTLLLRTQCISVMPNLAAADSSLRAGAKSLGFSLPLIDVPLQAHTLSAITAYSLIGAGIDIVRSTPIGAAADVDFPITRAEAMRAVASALGIPRTVLTDTGAVLPEGVEITDPEASDVVALSRLGILPQSFIRIPGLHQGITKSEAALLLARAAFHNGKISLLPDIPDLKALKSAARIPTFMEGLPELSLGECLERHDERSTAVTFSDLLPGDPLQVDLSKILTFGVKNAAEKTLWLIPATRRPTEFGVSKGQTKLLPNEPVTMLETVRNLLVLTCLPPDTRMQAILGLATKEVIQGSAETRVARDRLSDLPRDDSFASRILYRAQDHLKEFDLSLFAYAGTLLHEDVRSPASGLSLKEAGDMLASSLLLMYVRQGTMTPQEAEGRETEISAAISRDLLGKDVNWRDEGLLASTPFTRKMLLQFLVTVTQDRRAAESLEAVFSQVPIGELWWERLK